MLKARIVIHSKSLLNGENVKEATLQSGGHVTTHSQKRGLMSSHDLINFYLLTLLNFTDYEKKCYDFW